MNAIKILGLGVIGGLIPLSISYLREPNHTENNILRNNSNDLEVKFASTHQQVIPTTDFVIASDKTLNSVVHIVTQVESTTFQRDPFSEFLYGPGAGGREFKQYGAGSGSGVIVSEDGYIITNNHVIENASKIEVTLNDKRKYKAEIIGTDPSTDLAVLQIKEKNLPVIEIGNSDKVQVGEWVLAVGNPFNLTSTVTAGIISAKGRNINLLQRNNSTNTVPIESFIQTDAAVNPGNSGGALVNSEGKLIGINTAIASQTGSYSGYSFAIPVNLAKKVITDILEFGIVQRGYLGVKISDITQELKDKKTLSLNEGIYIQEIIPGGSAEKSGLHQGDIIIKIEDKKVNNTAQLLEEIGKKRPGDKINVTISDSDGYIKTKSLTLRNKDGETKLIPKSEIKKNTALGATFIKISSKDKKELGISNGIMIDAISNGKLKSLGLRPGMVITRINNEEIINVEQLTNKLNSVNKGILLEVITREGKKEYVGFGL